MDLEDGEYFWNCGEKFYAFNKEKWAALRETEYWVEHPMLSQLIDRDIEFTEKNEDFICAMTKYPMKNRRDAWVPYLFYIMEGGLQRIQLETTECTNCNWRGTIANPTLPMYYSQICMPDKNKRMRVCSQVTVKKLKRKGKTMDILKNLNHWLSIVEGLTCYGDQL